MEKLTNKEQFEIRKSHYMITSLGTKLAIGQCLTVKDKEEIKKSIKLFKRIGDLGSIHALKSLLIHAKENITLTQKLKRIEKSGLTLLKN